MSGLLPPGSSRSSALGFLVLGRVLGIWFLVALGKYIGTEAVIRVGVNKRQLIRCKAHGAKKKIMPACPVAQKIKNRYFSLEGIF